MRIGNLMICLWTPCLLLAGIGCSDGGPVLVPVKGKVTVGSGQPFAKGTVRFTPMDLNQGQGAYAITDEMGNYELIHFSQKPGIEPGRYAVSFALFQHEDGSPLPEPDLTKEFQPTLQDLGAVQFVAAEYSDAQSTKNMTDVKADGGVYDFTIPDLKAQLVNSDRR